MNIDILGCSGGVGGSSGSTCIRINESILIDAGTGLSELSLEEMRKIRHVFISHAHMDHICHLPMFLSNLFGHSAQPIEIYGLPETLKVLKSHIFNWEVWPNFLTLPNEKTPIMNLREIILGHTVTIDDIQFTPFSTEHTVPTVGYSVSNSDTHFVFTADTTYSEAFVQELNQLKDIDILMIECAFPDHSLEMAEISKHLTPKTVQQTLNGLKQQPKEIWITHLKPSYEHELREHFANTPEYKHWHILS